MEEAILKVKRESKIILVSGVAITFKTGDRVFINDTEIVIKDIPAYVMNETEKIMIRHYISTGEYMEYYLTREKITWAYYSEIPEDEELEEK